MAQIIDQWKDVSVYTDWMHEETELNKNVYTSSVDGWKDVNTYNNWQDSEQTSTISTYITKEQVSKLLADAIISSSEVDMERILQVIYSKNYQTKEQVDKSVEDGIKIIRDDAPEELDTFKEVSDRMTFQIV